MGADKIYQFPKWFKAEEFIEKHKLIVAYRKGYNVDEIINKNPLLKNNRNQLILFEIPDNDISSTIVRNKIKNNDVNNIDDYLEKTTFSYIIKENLYK